MTRLAITGIGEAVGLRMAERARDLGWSVRGLAASPAGRRRAESTGAKVLEGELHDGRVLERVLVGADVVVHARELVEGGTRDDYEQVNVKGTRCVARAAREAGVRQLVYLSSARVYGRRCPDRVAEDGPFSCEGDPYAHSKLKSEIEAWCQHKPNGMEVTILRPGHIYGGYAVPLMRRSAAAWTRGEILLPEAGERAINHLHVDNLLDALELVIEKRVGGQVFNITDGAATSARDYYAYLAHMLGRSEISTRPSWIADLTRKARAAIFEKRPESLATIPPWPGHAPGCHNINRARRMLGYEPRVSLAEGMRAVVERLHPEENNFDPTPCRREPSARLLRS